MLDIIETVSATQISQIMQEMGENARKATRELAMASSGKKNAALAAMTNAIWQGQQDILSANAADLVVAKEAGISASFIDRLTLDEARIKSIRDSLLAIAELDDPVGEVIAKWDRPNGLQIERVRTPIGVVGVIFEARPNVTADAGALCLKSGNAVILRGGSDSHHTSRAIHECMVVGLNAVGLPEHAIQMVPVTDRVAVGEMLSGLDGNIDVIVPRGGRGLVERVQSDARVPVFAHLEGLCHIYVDKSADLEMTVNVVANSKMRRSGICGAAETLLVDQAVIDSHLVPVLEKLVETGCEIMGDEITCAKFGAAKPAQESDWMTEYLDSIISVKIVNGIDGAIDHINQYSSNHTEAVLAEDGKVVEAFFNTIDSAILMHNASTQFADGGEFGMGAEIGIATGKMHARGPVGVEQLTSFKYTVRGSGQTRP